MQEKIKPGRVPETGTQFCYYCRTGKRIARSETGMGFYCTCDNRQCPWPIGKSNEEEKALEATSRRT